MSNMWGRSGAPMIQPTKDELRTWLSEARQEAKKERNLRHVAEYNLNLARRKLGTLVLEGKIAIPTERLGEMVIRMAAQEEIDAENLENQKFLAS